MTFPRVAKCIALALALSIGGAAHADITAFGAASTPADNGSQSSDTGAAEITPPASMQSNDYALLFVCNSDNQTTNVPAISNTGGQTWTSETTLASLPSGGTGSTENVHSRLFHARFNGTWSANPSVQMGTSTAGPLTLVMLVFRGVDTTTAVDVTPVSASYDATTTVTITGITTNTNGAMAVAFWCSRDDNTWSLVTGGWSQDHTQIRNTGGADNSIAHAYKVQATAGSTGDVRNDQATLGGDAGHTWILALKEQAVAKKRTMTIVVD